MIQQYLIRCGRHRRRWEKGKNAERVLCPAGEFLGHKVNNRMTVIWLAAIESRKMLFSVVKDGALSKNHKEGRGSFARCRVI